MRFPYAYVKWNLNIHHFLRSVCVSVGQTINCAKTAEPFEMLFGGRLLWAQAAMCQITVTVNFPCAAPSGLFQITSTTCISYVLTFLVSQ